MGFLDHLFKPKPREEKAGEGEGEDAGGNGKVAGAAPDPGEFLHPKHIGPIGGTVYSPTRPGPRTERAPEKRAPAATERQEIVIMLGDVLSRIPTQLLHTGMHDAKRELRFAVEELSADIARGRAVVPLSKIAALCPEVFVRRIEPADDFEIRLPLQKLVEQIGRLRRRDGVPAAAGISPTGSVDAASAQDSQPDGRKAASAFGDEEIQLSLAAILRGCPPEIIVGKLPRVGAGVRITLPYAPIERQFANDRVEVSSARFVSVLPPELRPHFAPRDGVKVPLPIEEILKNLPGAADLPLEDSPTVEGPDAEAALADFLPQAEDHSLAPAQGAGPVSETVGELPGDPPADDVVAAQTPREMMQEPLPPSVPSAEEAAPDIAPPVAVESVLPAPHVFAPPPPVVVAAPAAPARNVVDHFERAEPGTIRSGVAEETLPSVPARPMVRLHPPPVVRPVLVQPPPILAPGPEPEPAPQPAMPGDPGTRVNTAPVAMHDEPGPFPLEALQSLFMTDAPLDLAVVARLAASLPGVCACALDWRGEKATAGDLPDGCTFEALHAAAVRLSGAACDVGALSLGALQTVSLHGERASISVFARPGALLVVLHRAFPPGVRERLATVAAELSRQ